MLIYIHKEEELDDVERLYPAKHYVMVDDKLRILDDDEEDLGRPRHHGVSAPGPLRDRSRDTRTSTRTATSSSNRIARPGQPRPFRHPEPLTTGDATVKATQQLHDLGQSLWLDNITRDLLDSGTLQRYIDELSVTGLTSNPTIFDKAIASSSVVRRGDPAPGRRAAVGRGAVLRAGARGPARAADLFAPIHERTAGVDGWVSLEVSPLLAHDTQATIAAGQARCTPRPTGPTCSSRSPARPRACPRSRRRSSPACRSTSRCCSRATSTSRRRRGLHARPRAPHRGRARAPTCARSPRCSSAAGTRRRREGARRAAQPARHRRRRSSAYAPIASCSRRDRWQRLEGQGARPQRLLFASTGTKDPQALRHRSTSTRSRRPTPSTPCRRRRCSRSPTTASVDACDAARTAAMRSRCWQHHAGPASTSTRWPGSCRPTAPRRFVDSWQDLLGSRSTRKSKALA